MLMGPVHAPPSPTPFLTALLAREPKPRAGPETLPGSSTSRALPRKPQELHRPLSKVTKRRCGATDCWKDNNCGGGEEIRRGAKEQIARDHVRGHPPRQKPFKRLYLGHLWLYRELGFRSGLTHSPWSYGRVYAGCIDFGRCLPVLPELTWTTQPGKTLIGFFFFF